MIALTHRRLDGVVRRAPPAKHSHDPSARVRRLRRALNGSTALVAVALLGTLLVAAPPASAGSGGNGGVSGIHNGNVRGPGGSGGTGSPTSPGGGGGAGTYGGGGGGGGYYTDGGYGGKDCNGCTGGGGAGGAHGERIDVNGSPGGAGSDGGGGGGGGGGAGGFLGYSLPNGHVTGGNGGNGGNGSSRTFHVGAGGGGGGAGGYGAIILGTGNLGTISVNITGGNGGSGGSGGSVFAFGTGYGGGGGTGGGGLQLINSSQVTVGGGVSIAGGNGGNGGSAGGGFYTIGANGGTGGTGLLLSANSSQVTVGAGASIAGGKGGTGGYGTYNGTGGAAGGVGISSAVGAAISNSGSINGGTGGAGGKGGETAPGHYAAGGTGGIGGAGVSFYGNSSNSLINANSGTINGGTGGAGGYGGEAGKRSKGGGAGGSGGAGGTGVNLGYGLTIVAINNGTITGGTGGSGGTGRNTTLGFTPGNGGQGGAGGTGVTLGNGAALTNGGTINGGTGGQGGAGGSDTGPVGIGGNGGNGGNGGAGVFVNGGTLINGGTINGGTGGGGGAYGKGSDSHTNGSPGSAGSNGTNVVVTNGTVINSGEIVAGYGANAITFTSGTNLLELRAGSDIQGTVDATSGTNTLALGGTANATFGVAAIGSQYLGFENFEKTGTSTWTLTGSTSAATAWAINQGTLSISSDSNLGAAGGFSFDGGTLQNTATFTTARAITLNAEGGTFNTAADLTAGGTISGAGALTKTGAATLTLTGTNTYTGGTTVGAGTLMVNGTVGGTVDVASGGSLGGFGTIGGTTTIASGGTLIGRQGQVLNFGSDLTLSSGSNVNVSLGTPDPTALFNVAGNLTLGGTLNITDLGGFGMGVYGLFDYGGSLNNSTGLTIGTVPPGVNPGDVSIQTSVPNQVNLIDTKPGILLDFWDGAAGHDNGKVDGGNGVWALSTTNQNWTDATGTANSEWSNDHFAIFEGQAGTVTVDDSGGQIKVTGMQFATNGYLVEGDSITLDLPETIIRTGIGGPNGAGVIATIASELTGAGGLVKTDFGTLVLTAANTYTGGTIVREGTLQLGDGGASGSIMGNVTDNGVLAFNRSDTYTFTGVISGTGMVNQVGRGTTVLTGANTYSGGTAIGAGILSVVADGNLGAATGGLTFNGGTLQTTATFATARVIELDSGGGTLQTDADLAASGVIFGTGALTKTGNGTLTLTGDNVYTGGTTIDAGTLQIGAGSTSGSIVGDVTNNSVLAFNRSDDLSYGGVITGTGALAKDGAGTLTLTGTNTYNGGTTINAGTLQIGSGGTSGSITGDVTDNGVLAFDRFNDLTFAGTISGTGALAKDGFGTLTLTGSNSYNGGTTINAGRLSVAADGNLGAARGGLTFDGGTLQNTAAFTTQRNITLNAGGGTFETNAGLTANGVISGAGGLTKTGGATLTLTGANTYGGGTTIEAGTLSVAADGNLGAATGGLTFDGGTLQNTAAFITARNVTLRSRGGTLQTDADLTASSTISGAGALTKTGAATLTLTGTNTYTGDTIISNGTLQLGAGGTSGSIAGNITDNGVLAVNRSDTLSLTGIISGSGAFEQNGAGTTILTGTNTYTGATTVDAGTLEVDGAITSSSAVNVNAGATLSGTGTVDPNPVTIASGGTFAPGMPGAPGSSMTIAGNLAFQSGALYVIYLNPSSTTMANVTGTASLAGTVEADFASGAYLNNKSYDILHSAGLVGTKFSGLTTVNAPNFATSLSYTTTDVFLDLTATLGIGTHLTVNEQNVANALNNFFNSGGTLPPNFADIFGRTGSNLANTLQQLDGEAATGAERAAFQLTTEFLNLMLDPWAGGGTGGSAGAAPSFAPEEQGSLPPDVAQAYAGVLKAPPKQTFDQRWSAWGTGFGGSSRTNGDPLVVGSNNVTANDYGFAAGMDYHVTPDTVYGFALAGSGTNWNLAQGLGGGRSDAFQAGIYAKTHMGPAYIAAALAFTNHWFNTSRTAALGDQLTAKFDGQSYGGRLETGYRYAVLPMVGVTPYAALQAQAFHTPSYSETDLSGTGFALSYNAINATDTRSELGARFDDLTMLGAMPLVLRARVAWAHDWVTNPSLGAVFQTLPSAAFVVNGAVPPKDSALASAAAELHLSANWTLAAKFDGEFASGAQTYAGTGTLRYTW